MTLVAHRGRCPRCGSDPQGVAQFRAALAVQADRLALLPALHEALEFIEDQEDVIDSDDGPRANRAMQVAQKLRAAIARTGAAA